MVEGAAVVWAAESVSEAVLDTEVSKVVDGAMVALVVT